MKKYKRLFTTGKIRNMVVNNRIIMAPMEKNYSNKDGSIKQNYIDYIVQRAKGGVGLILLESTYIDPLGKGKIYQLGIHDDMLIPALKKLTDAVHKYESKIGLQLNFSGRETSSRVIGRQPVAPSPVPCNPAGGEIPRELTVDEIKMLVKKFTDAAVRTKKAGFDTIMIHGAHGYLINSFLSPYSNKRTDEYGGSFENRMKFPLEVTEAIRKVVGSDYPLVYRLSANEYIEGGLTLKETSIFAQKLEEAGIDLIDVSAGIYESADRMCSTMEYTSAPLLPLAAAIKEVVNIPVSTVNRIDSPDLAEKILQEEKADFITLGRPLHADPNLPNKLKNGRPEDILPCIYCSQGCSDWLGLHKPITCMINTTVSNEREFEIKEVQNKKNVMIIGAGPAGMEAARVAALRGHKVVLYEKEKELGGQIRIARNAPKREKMGLIIEYLFHQLEKVGVEIKLNNIVTKELIYDIKPDALVFATGSIPFFPPSIPGTGEDFVYNVEQILLEKVSVGKKAVVVGAGGNGCHTAEYLAEKGAEVILIEPSDGIGKGLGFRSGWFLKKSVEQNPHINIKVNTTLEEIHSNSIVIQKGGKREIIPDIDTLVLSLGNIENNQLAETIKMEKLIPEVYTIGDCVKPRTALEALHEGTHCGYSL